MPTSYLQDLIKILGLGAALAALPILASLADLQPPWPPAIGYVSALLILVAALVVWEWVKRSRIGNRRAWIVASLTSIVVGLACYLTLYSQFIENRPGTDLRVVRGYECSGEAQLLYGRQCPDLPREALDDAEWETVVLWTRNSVTTVRLGLVLSWLLFVCGLIMALGAIVAGRKTHSKLRHRTMQSSDDSST